MLTGHEKTANSAYMCAWQKISSSSIRALVNLIKKTPKWHIHVCVAKYPVSNIRAPVELD